MCSMEEYNIETSLVADLRVALSDESHVEDKIVDAILAAGSVARSAPGLQFRC